MDNNISFWSKILIMSFWYNKKHYIGLNHVRKIQRMLTTNLNNKCNCIFICILYITHHNYNAISNILCIHNSSLTYANASFNNKKSSIWVIYDKKQRFISKTDFNLCQIKKQTNSIDTTKIMIPKRFLETLEDYFFTTLHLFLALVLILGLFYIRFLPRVSRDLWQNMTNYQLFLVLFILCCIILNIYNTLKIMGYIKTKLKTPSYIYEKFSYYLNSAIKYIYDVLENFYEFIWWIGHEVAVKIDPKIELLHYQVLRPLVKSFTNKKQSLYYFYFLISLKLIPKIVFVSALFYDVIYCQHFHYTFRCIPFLLVPLLEQVFLFMMKHVHKRHVNGLVSFLIIKPIPDTHECFYALNTEIKDLPYGPKDFHDFYHNHVYPTDQILRTIGNYETWQDKFFDINYLFLFLQTVRLFVYIFILIYGII